MFESSHFLYGESKNSIYNEKILTSMGLEKLAFFNDTRLFYLQYPIHEMSFSFRSIQINID